MPAYERIVNKEKREATLRMYGVIGRDVDGNRMALDLTQLDGTADTIHIHINSNGGSVDQGLSVVSAILSARAFIHVHVNGIAASMAAVIAVCGDKVSMQDYAKLMIHDPFLSGKGSNKLSPKDIKALDSIKDTLQTILSRRGCDKDKIASLMKDETWFNAEEAKTAGLIDDVVTTPRKEELSNLSTQELMDRVMNEYQPKKSFNMNEIAKALGLPENATEQQILDAIRVKEKSRNDQMDALVSHYMALGAKNGIVTDKNTDKMQRLAAADFELFAEMVSEAPQTDAAPEEEDDASVKKTKIAQEGRLSAVLAELRATGAASATQKGSKTARTYDWYQKNDPRALARMESEKPKEFERLLNEYESNME